MKLLPTLSTPQRTRLPLLPISRSRPLDARGRKLTAQRLSRQPLPSRSLHPCLALSGEHEDQILEAEPAAPSASPAVDGALQLTEVDDTDESIEREDPVETSESSRRRLEYNIAIQKLRAKNLYAECWNIYGKLLADGLQPDGFTYAMMFSVCAKQKQYERAVQLWEELKEGSCPLDRVMYNAFMQVHFATDRAEMALELFHTMKEEGIKVDNVTYNTLISGLSFSAYVRPAVQRQVDQLLAEMRERGIEWDAYTHRALIKLSLNCKDVEKALRYANDMIRKDLNWKTSVIASIFRMFSMIGRGDKAERIAQTCWKLLVETEKKNIRGPLSDVYTALMEVFANCGQWSRVFGLLDVMREKGLDRSPRMYTALLRGMSHTKVLDQDAAITVKVLVDEMNSRGIFLTSEDYALAITICLKARDIHLAQLLFDRMRAKRHRATSTVCHEFMRYYTDAAYVSNWSTALQDVLKMQEVMKENSIRVSLGCYSCVLRAACKAQDWKVIEQTLSQMTEAELHPPTRDYNTLIDACSKATDPAIMKAAWKYFEDMKSQRVPLSVVTYTSMITVCDALGDMEAGLKLLREMKAAGIHPNELTYTSLMHLAGETGNINMVEELFDTVLESGLRLNSTVYSVLIYGYGKANRIDKVLEVYKALQKKGGFIDLTLFCNLISAAGACQRIDLVYKFFDEFKQRRIPMNHAAYTLLSATLRESGDAEGAAAIQELEKEDRKSMHLRPSIV